MRQRPIEGREGCSSLAPGEYAYRATWLPVALISALLIAAALLLWPTTQSIKAEWVETENLTYTHGYGIFAICAWVLWRRRVELAAVEARADFRAVFVLIGLSLLWLIVYRSGLQLAHQALLPLMMWIAVRAAFGADAARHCRFIFAYLYLAIPVWNVGNDLLQSITVHAVRMMLDVSAIPAHVAGNMVYIPSGVFEIAGGCSGLHFFIVALAIAALHGELQDASMLLRCVLLALGGALAMLSNWLRVFAIIIAGYVTDMQHFLVSVDHYYFGWGMFALVVVAFFWIARRLQPANWHSVEKSRAANLEGSIADVRGNAFSGDYAREAGWRLDTRWRGPLMACVMAIACLSVGPAWSLAVPKRAAAPDELPWLPTDLPDWSGPSPYAGHWRPTYSKADRIEHGIYENADSSVAVYMAEYLDQYQGKELIGYGNSILGNSPVSVVAHSRRDVHSLLHARAGIREVQELEIETAGGKRGLIWHYYEIGSLRRTRGIEAQLAYGLLTLISSPRSRVVGLSTSCESQCDTARLRLAAVLGALDLAFAARQ